MIMLGFQIIWWYCHLLDLFNLFYMPGGLILVAVPCLYANPKVIWCVHHSEHIQSRGQSHFCPTEFLLCLCLNGPVIHPTLYFKLWSSYCKSSEAGQIVVILRKVANDQMQLLIPLCFFKVLGCSESWDRMFVQGVLVKATFTYINILVSPGLSCAMTH